MSLPGIDSWSRLLGVNLAGGEFGENIPGNYEFDYIYPTKGEIDYFLESGMNTFRIPFLWERLQQKLNANFDPIETERLETLVQYAVDKGAYVILDPHNYARYHGQIIGQSGVSTQAFADFWRRLALLFPDERIIFGLMNEPHTMETEIWLRNANAAILAIRGTGANNLILVPGNGWSNAFSWHDNWYGSSNSEVMLDVSDPGNNYAFEVHQYLDADSSGKSEACPRTDLGPVRLAEFTNWLSQNGQRGFLGEFGVGPNEPCYQALDSLLSHLEEHDDVWIGWTYWAAGPWWGDYMFSIEPQNGEDRPQMKILKQYL